MDNCIILNTGALTRRAGTKFITSYNAPCIVEAFVFKRGIEYACVFLDAQVDFWQLHSNGTRSLVHSLTDCPWDESMLNALYITQTLDTMIIAHEDMPMQRITRTSLTSFDIAALSFETDSEGKLIYQPYYKFADPSITLTPSGKTGSITVSANKDVFSADYVGKNLRLKHASDNEWKQIKVDAFTNAKTITATTLENLDDTKATADWDEPIFSDIRGYAKTAAFYQGRLIFGGTRSLPSHLLMSNVDAYFKFDVGKAEDSDSIQVSMRSDSINEIRGLSSMRHLQIFTDQGELYMPESSLTPSKVNFQIQTRVGCSNKARPLPFDGATLFISDTGNSVHEFLFTDNEQAYGATNLTKIASHLINSPVDFTALYAGLDRSEQYALVCNGDGTIACFFSDRAENISGWTRWSTQGAFVSIKAVGSYLLAVVKRTLGGEEVYCLEEFSFDAVLDCSNVITSDGTSTSYSAPHLTGESVHLISGNSYLGDYTANSAGTIDTIYSREHAEVGLGFLQSFLNVPVAGASAEGSLMGIMKRLVRVMIRFKGTLSATIDGQSMLLRQVNDDMSQDADSFNGTLELSLTGFSRDGEFPITQETPHRLTLLAYNLEVDV